MTLPASSWRHVITLHGSPHTGSLFSGVHRTGGGPPAKPPSSRLSAGANQRPAQKAVVLLESRSSSNGVTGHTRGPVACASQALRPPTSRPNAGHAEG